MAETRKYDPSASDPISEAIRAAMGEQVRPVTPGEKPARVTPAATPAEKVTLASFQYAVPKPVADSE